jgi:hypothetical protein
MIKREFCLLILVLSIVITGTGQELPVTVATHLDTAIATIGDRIHLRISLNYPPDARFEVPQVEDNLGEWTVIQQNLSEPRKIKNGFRQDWILELTVFDTGKVIIPSIPIKVFTTSDSTAAPLVFETDEASVRVISVLPPGTTEPKDIKPPFPIRTIIPWRWIIFIVLILAVLLGWYRYYRRWKRLQPSAPLEEEYLEPPHLVAFRKLNELRKGLYKTEDEIRSFHFSLSEIIREYLERRYFIRALEMTSQEIRQAFDLLKIDGQVVKEFVKLFNRLDMVKFARQIPKPEALVAHWELTYQCIDKTKRESFLNRRSL